jgi:hypothetical protein
VKKTATPPASTVSTPKLGNAMRNQFPDSYYVDPLGIDRYVVQEKLLFSWQAPTKVFRKRTRSQLLQIAGVIVLIDLILVLLQEWFLAAVVASLSVLYLFLETTPPMYLECQVTTIGLKIEDGYYYWPEMSQFWFDEKHDAHFMNFRHLFPAPHIVRLIIHPQDEEKLKVTVGTYLLYKKPRQTIYEKIWQQIKVRLPINIDFLSFS